VDTLAALARDLASLTAMLATPGADLEALLAGLADRMRRAVPSYVGLSMTVVMDGCPITLAATPGGEVATSMRLPLTALGAAEAGSVVVFYAAQPGAFVDLAADAEFAAGDGDGLVVLDDELHRPPAVSGLAGLDILSAVNRAIGHLIGDGYHPEEAGAELDRRARIAGVSRHAAALRVVPEPGERGVDHGQDDV